MRRLNCLLSSRLTTWRWLFSWRRASTSPVASRKQVRYNKFRFTISLCSCSVQEWYRRLESESKFETESEFLKKKSLPDRSNEEEQRLPLLVLERELHVCWLFTLKHNAYMMVDLKERETDLEREIQIFPFFGFDFRGRGRTLFPLIFFFYSFFFHFLLITKIIIKKKRKKKPQT